MPRSYVVILAFVAFLFSFLFAGSLLLPLEAAGDPSSGALPDASGATGSPSTLGYGFGGSLDQPFHEVDSQALASVFFFNLSPQNAFGTWVPFGGEGCTFFVNILDDKGRLVRRPLMVCPMLEGMSGAPDPNRNSSSGAADLLAMPLGPYPFPAGTFRRVDVPLPLLYASSQTGDPDGTPLPGGLYTLSAKQLFNGPGPGAPLFGFGGGDPEARVPFRIYQCSPDPQGPLPVRELVQGAFSGYRYNDPAFYGEDLVLRTGEAGLQFWGQHTAIFAPPAVDLAHEMVLVSLAGYRASGGSTIRITSVVEKECHLEVSVFETFPPFAMAVITNPFDIVAVPRSLKEVRFIHVAAFPIQPLQSDSNSQCTGDVASCQ